MSNELAVGVDYGDLRIRAAYAKDGVAHPVALTRELAAPIYFDPYANISSLGVGFPSILQTVGTKASFTLGDRTETVESLVAKRLTTLHKVLSEAGSRTVGRSVFAVPASLGQQGRRALLACAERAGFTDVSLIDAGAAAAIADHGQRSDPSTTVVYRLGYGDCEISLVRLTRGRCRVVGSTLIPGVSGQRFDALVMESMVLALREKRVFLGLRQFTPEHWLDFRDTAESARHALATQSEVAVKLPAQLFDGTPALRLRLDSAGLAGRVAPLLERTIQGVLTLLEQKDLELDNIDRFLLVGGVAKTPPVSDLLAAAFDGRPRPIHASQVSVGALLEACRLDDATLQVPAVADEPEVLESGAGGADVVSPTRSSARLEAVASEGDAPFVHVEELVPEASAGNERPASPPPRQEKVAHDGGGFEEVRRRIDEGRIEEAEALLQSLDREVEELRSRLEAHKPSEAQRLIQQARALLTSGRDQEAINLSHQAYAKDPNDPTIFATMMKIHADVGLALDRPEQYEASLRILRCAHNHDQTDRSIHHAIAERHLRHAIAMRRLNNPAKALEAVQTALTFEPKHPELNRLLQELIAEAATSES